MHKLDILTEVTVKNVFKSTNTDGRAVSTTCWALHLVLGHQDEQGSPRGENSGRRQGIGSNKYKPPLPQLQKNENKNSIEGLATNLHTNSCR